MALIVHLFPRDRDYHLKTYKSVVPGSKLVDWLLAQVSMRGPGSSWGTDPAPFCCCQQCDHPGSAAGRECMGAAPAQQLSVT